MTVVIISAQIFFLAMGKYGKDTMMRKSTVCIVYSVVCGRNRLKRHAIKASRSRAEDAVYHGSFACPSPVLLCSPRVAVALVQPPGLLLILALLSSSDVIPAALYPSFAWTTCITLFPSGKRKV